ncbi:MAG: SDR family NAD(P)-dependent oxidoreductase [Dehalococcoidia bacterium]
MAQAHLGKKRALILGGETAAGRVLATALAAAGAHTAIVAASPDAAVAFEVQRLSRRIGATSQAIDATNEMALRVMTRQLSKRLGGLDLLLFCADLGDGTVDTLAMASRFAAREIARAGEGAIVIALPGGTAADIPALAAEYEPQGVRVLALDLPPQPDEAWAREVLERLP